MNSARSHQEPLDNFVRPMLHRPAWGVKQGHGSFLTFEFGEPKLKIAEWFSSKEGMRRSAYVIGEWHLWIYCCHWRVLQHGTQVAWSEDASEVIGRATIMLKGQKLLGVSVDSDAGSSIFTFDLGGFLETWPYGDDRTEEQWTIMTDTEAFAYRADGLYCCDPIDRPAGSERWLSLR